MKVNVFFIFILLIMSGCATFRDACMSEQILLDKYGRDVDSCTDALRRYSDRRGRDWVEIGDRVYVNSNGR